MAPANCCVLHATCHLQLFAAILVFAEYCDKHRIAAQTTVKEAGTNRGDHAEEPDSKVLKDKLQYIAEGGPVFGRRT